MKTLNKLLVSMLLILMVNSVGAQHDPYDDDIYYSPKDKKVFTNTIAAPAKSQPSNTQSAPVDPYENTTPNSNFSDPNKNDEYYNSLNKSNPNTSNSNQSSSTSSSNYSNSAKEGNTYVTNNYSYYDDNDYYYSSRIRRFYRPSINIGYYNGFYSGYTFYDPFSWNSGVYLGYSWGPSYYGYNGFRDNCYWGPDYYYNYDPFVCRYNPFRNPYAGGYYGYTRNRRAYNNGFYDGYYYGGNNNMYYNNGNNNYYGNSGGSSGVRANNTSTHYGRRNGMSSSDPGQRSLNGQTGRPQVESEKVVVTPENDNVNYRRSADNVYTRSTNPVYTAPKRDINERSVNEQRTSTPVSGTNPGSVYNRSEGRTYNNASRRVVEDRSTERSVKDHSSSGNGIQYERRNDAYTAPRQIQRERSAEPSRGGNSSPSYSTPASSQSPTYSQPRGGGSSGGGGGNSYGRRR